MSTQKEVVAFLRCQFPRRHQRRRCRPHVRFNASRHADSQAGVPLRYRAEGRQGASRHYCGRPVLGGDALGQADVFEKHMSPRYDYFTAAHDDANCRCAQCRRGASFIGAAARAAIADDASRLDGCAGMRLLRGLLVGRFLKILLRINRKKIIFSRHAGWRTPFYLCTACWAFVVAYDACHVGLALPLYIIYFKRCWLSR